MTRRDDGPSLATLALAATLALVSPLVALVLGYGVWLWLAVVLVAGAGALWIGGAWYLAGGSRRPARPRSLVPGRPGGPEASTEWASLPERGPFERVDTAEGDVYETRVEGRPVTVRRAGDGRDRRTLVAAPLSVARPGTGLSTSDPEATALPDGAGARSLLRREGGRLQVDDRVGVVRYTADRQVDDADRLLAVARTVGRVAGVVEREATPESESASELHTRATERRRRLQESERS